MTEQEFVSAWKSDPIKVFQRFIESLAEMNEEGMSSVAVLDEIGISEIRLRDIKSQVLERRKSRKIS